MKKSFLLLFSCFFLISGSSVFGQYARLTFYSDNSQPFLVRANGKDLSSEMATRLRVRVNHGNKYNLEIFTPGAATAVIEKTVRINPALISASYMLKQNKKGEFVLKTRDSQMEQAAPVEQKKSSGITYEYEMTETSAGPDGVTSKSSKGSGTLDGNGLNSRSTKSSASMDGKGMNMNSETKETSMDALGTLNTLGKLGKSAKKKKAAKAAADGRDLVVEEVVLASGKAAVVATEPMSETPAAAAGTSETIPQPVAKVDIEPVGGEDGIGRVIADQGFEFYILSEPIRGYKVVFEVETGSMTTEMLSQKERGIKNAMDSMIEEVRKKKEKKKYAGARIDALITVEGSEAKAVTFTDNKGASMGRVHKFLDVELYIAAEPTQPYEVVFEYANDKLMIGKPDIEGRTKRTIKRIRKENPELEFDGIVSENGMTYQCIKLK